MNNSKNKHIIPQNVDFWQILKEKLLDYAKEIIEEMIEAERDWFCAEVGDMKNGFRYRSLDTLIGKIENLKIGRTRKERFFPSFLKPYQRRLFALDEFIIALYSAGLSTRKISKVLERFYNINTSPSLISNVTEKVKEKLKAWKNRKLNKKYIILFIDAGFFYVRRDTVENEAVYFVLAIDEDGYRELIDFIIAPQESASIWEEALSNLKNRGIESVDFIVADGLAGLDKAVMKVFPSAKFQLCWLHKVKRVLHKIRIQDRQIVALLLKNIYKAESREKALKAFSVFKNYCQNKYPNAVKSVEKDLPYLLNFFYAPPTVRNSIYTTNLLERTIKEIRRRIKIVDSFPSPDSLENSLFIIISYLNSSWANRKLKGFSLWNFKISSILEDSLTHFS